jgi:predicted DNA-binding transcriptional regulator AlpA
MALWRPQRPEDYPSRRLLSYDDLKPAKGIKYSLRHLLRMINDGTFPPRLGVSERYKPWVEGHIDEWRDDHIASLEEVDP